MSTTMPPSDLDLAPTEPAPAFDHESSPTTFFDDHDEGKRAAE